MCLRRTKSGARGGARGAEVGAMEFLVRYRTLILVWMARSWLNHHVILSVLKETGMELEMEWNPCCFLMSLVAHPQQPRDYLCWGSIGNIERSLPWLAGGVRVVRCKKSGQVH